MNMITIVLFYTVNEIIMHVRNVFEGRSHFERIIGHIMEGAMILPILICPRVLT